MAVSREIRSLILPLTRRCTWAGEYTGRTMQPWTRFRHALHFVARRSATLSLLWLGRRYLGGVGWTRSRKVAKSVDATGSPVPWFTYAATDFLQSRIPTHLRVFEWGAGGSTLWWAQRTAEVVTCEHDPDWYNEVLRVQPSNVTIILRSIKGNAYASEVLNHRLFDVIVIDGADRLSCANFATDALSPDGVIVWDNSDRASAEEGLELLRSAGFKRIDFRGLGPIGLDAWTTSVLYKSTNCLEI